MLIISEKNSLPNSMKILFLSLLLLSGLSVFAQKESLDDLVPFRKGNKWGIVHHDGKEFYKPVFDTVIPFKSDVNFQLFSTQDVGKVVEVIMKGKRMWLKADKSLVDIVVKERG